MVGNTQKHLYLYCVAISQPRLWPKQSAANACGRLGSGTFDTLLWSHFARILRPL